MQQNDIYNIPLPRGPGPKNKTQKGQRTWNKLVPAWIKKTQDSSRGHKISTRNGSVICSDLTYRFLGILDRSSQGVFVSKNQTKVTSPLQLPARETALPPLYFRFPCSNSPGLPTPSLSTESSS
jgi:hypothetical protein